MKTLTYTVNAYEYNELSQAAKNKVRERLYETEDILFFNEMLEDSISETFPKSQLEYQYSLNNCQGDGLSVYGTLSTMDIIDYIENNQQKLELTNKQVKRMKFYCNMLEDWGIGCQIHENYYGYAYFNRNDILFDIYDTFADELENANFKNIHYGNIRRMSSVMTSFLEDFCYDWEKRGYNYFQWAFNASDDEIRELCDANEWLFDENGKLL